MTGIIVTGHGHFPTGILSAIALVAGKPENTAGVDFKEGCSSSDLKEAMKLAMESLEGEEVLILADLVGGPEAGVYGQADKGHGRREHGIPGGSRIFQTHVRA